MGNVSVIIPSIGRRDYLKRAISYYEKSGFDVIAATNTPIADAKAKGTQYTQKNSVHALWPMIKQAVYLKIRQAVFQVFSVHKIG